MGSWLKPRLKFSRVEPSLPARDEPRGERGAEACTGERTNLRGQMREDVMAQVQQLHSNQPLAETAR